MSKGYEYQAHSLKDVDQSEGWTEERNYLLLHIDIILS